MILHGGAGLSVLVALLAAQAPAVQPPIGVAEVSDGQLCMAVPGVPLTEGSPVTLVRVDSPQRVIVVVVEREAPSCQGLERAMVPGPYYVATPSTARAWEDGIWLAVAGRPATRQQGQQVAIAVSVAYPNARVRSCASTEGLHLTVWAGQPLRSRRVWHQYYYLRYDVEPTCQPADYRD